MVSNKKSYDGAHDYKQELKSGYRHSEWFETDTYHNMKKTKCKLQKVYDGFYFDEIYEVEFAGVVWWATDWNGKRVCGTSEIWEKIDE